ELIEQRLDIGAQALGPVLWSDPVAGAFGWQWRQRVQSSLSSARQLVPGLDRPADNHLPTHHHDVLAQMRGEARNVNVGDVRGLPSLPGCEMKEAREHALC